MPWMFILVTKLKKYAEMGLKHGVNVQMPFIDVKYVRVAPYLADVA